MSIGGDAPTIEVDVVRPRSVDAGRGDVTDPRAGSPGDAPTPRRLPTPIRPSDFGRTDVFMIIASAVSAAALVWIVFYQVTSLSGALGYLVCWYLTFLALLWIVTAQVIERQVATDRVVAVVVVSAALLIVSLVVFIVAWVAFKAVRSIHWVPLFTEDQKNFQVADPNALDHVGILHASSARSNRSPWPL